MKSSITVSIPKSQTIRGYEIARMPIGQFLKATQLLQELPQTIMQSLFPNTDAQGVLTQLQSLTKDTLQELFIRAIGAIPEQVIRIFAELSGIPEQKLLDDPNVGLDGLAEMAGAWIEVNGIENFIKAAGALAEKVRKTKATSGSSD